MAEEKIGEVTGKMSAMAGDVTAKAGQHWDKLESIFEERAAKAMSKLGVPSARTWSALIERIDELSAQLSQDSRRAARRRSRARAAKKTGAARKTAA